MTSFANRFNTVSFNIDTTDFTFARLGDLYKENGAKTIYPLNAIFITQGKFGANPIFVVAEAQALVSMPTHLTGTCREILADPEAVQTIQEGRVGFQIYEYESHGRPCYSITFVDM